VDNMEFRAAVARAGKSIRSLASDIGISEQAFHNKLNGKTEFKGSEIKRISEVLGLRPDAVNHIFFGW
jgi:lambda repressor-like predicted transcriptional regulator